MRGLWGEKERELGEVPASPAHSSRARHYLIAARAHWLVSPGGRPNATEPVNPSRPAGWALALPPVPAAPRGLQAPKGHGVQEG